MNTTSMSRIEVYNIKGNKYKYEVTDTRIGDKRIRTKKYLGPVTPKYKMKKALESESKTITSSNHIDAKDIGNNLDSAGNVKSDTNEKE